MKELVHILKNTRQHLMTGVSHMIPFVVVGGLMISPRERIVVLEVEDTWLVVGIVPGQIKTLHTLPKGELPLPAAGDGAFGQWLKQFAERKNEH